ncbi:MAG: sigma-54-dependent transcriptional regulator [Candidatus Aminicenantia bacterium]
MEGKILVIDDEKSIRDSLRGILEDEGFEVKEAESGESALEMIKKERFDAILLDIWLPGIDGIDVLKKIKEKDDCPVIMISGHATIDTAVKATKMGAYDFFEKPLSTDRVIVTIKNALKQKKLEEENILLKEKVKGKLTLIGESKQIREIKQLIEDIAPTNGRVLITGENGTGKELVARLIHEKSSRRYKRFAEINCAAIPDELIESELFGYVKGAFTNALKDKKGKFLLADGGTLFLDEIGDMSLKTQAKVLRVIEEQKFEPLGSTESIKIDTRIISATNKDLQIEIRKGNFREDLYFRINVIPIYVPPLRERKDDIPLLAKHFHKEFSEEYGRKPKELTDEALEKLTNYSWPGNVRELRNLIERLVIMVKGEKIEAKDIPLLSEGRKTYDSLFELSYSEAKEVFERTIILKHLKDNNWNIVKTAQSLGLERTTLYKKMKSLGISVEEKEI